MPDRRHDRIDRAQAALARRGIGALLLGPSSDLRWLLGYDPPPLERLTMLVVPAAGDPLLIAPALEAPLAEEHLFGGDGGDLGIKVQAWQETEDPVALVTGSLAAVGADATGASLAVGDHLWATFLLRLQAALPAVQWLPASLVTGPLRARKDPAELDALARAGAAIDRVVEALGEWVRVGRTELEVAADLDRAIRAGHERTNFTIVGSGPNGASPHHIAGPRRLEPGDAVVVDIGGRLDGYCSDTTRTVVLGEPDPAFAAMYEVLRQAQEAGCQAVRPGVTAASVDAACRQPITSAGYGERFIHRTGHGIGLDEHEDPWIVAGNDEPLEPGMAFSVEPGIYIPGRWGARIEDIVVCTQDGGRRLNATGRELKILPV
jgi:Xaa-Pro aminopeptidase